MTQCCDRAVSDGKGCSLRHLEHNDYYSEGERVVGEWSGPGSALLGLNGATNSGDFEALRQGFHPSTGEFLRVRHSADRTAAEVPPPTGFGFFTDRRTGAELVTKSNVLQLESRSRFEAC